MDAKFLLALSLVGCAAPATQEVRHEPEAPRVVPSIPKDVAATLQAGAVTHDSFARRTFYTWATTAGVARIRKEGRLLIETDAEGYFVQRLDELALADGPHAELARVLAHHPGFGARRYAWTRPFATRVPLTDRSYGEHLIAASLKPNAVIARFDSREAVAFKLVDLEGQEVPLGRMLADPSTLAAVYHVAKHPVTGDEFREFVLINESMIEEWSLGTPAVAAVIDADLQAVRALAQLGLADAPASPKWTHAGDDLYAASIAFDTPRHRPTRKNLNDLALLMTEVARDDAPLVVTPTTPFRSLAPEPPKVPPLPFGFGVKPRIYKCS
jgi:hypothetical protein